MEEKQFSVAKEYQRLNINPNKENSASQTTLILEYMEQGHAITPLDALRHFSCMRLPARIHDIEKAQGIQVKRQRVKVRNQFGTEVSVMSYSLEK